MRATDAQASGTVDEEALVAVRREGGDERRLGVDAPAYGNEVAVSHQPVDALRHQSRCDGLLARHQAVLGAMMPRTVGFMATRSRRFTAAATRSSPPVDDRLNVGVCRLL